MLVLEVRFSLLFDIVVVKFLVLLMVKFLFEGMVKFYFKEIEFERDFEIVVFKILRKKIYVCILFILFRILLILG